MNDKPFLRPEQRVDRLFELNQLHHVEQCLVFAIGQADSSAELKANALMTVRAWADSVYARIERRYRILAVENMMRREVTTWLK